MSEPEDIVTHDYELQKSRDRLVEEKRNVCCYRRAFFSGKLLIS